VCSDYLVFRHVNNTGYKVNHSFPIDKVISSKNSLILSFLLFLFHKLLTFAIVNETDTKMRIAANKVSIDGKWYSNHVVEIDEGMMTAHYPLTQELEHTEWWREVIVEDGHLTKRVRL